MVGQPIQIVSLNQATKKLELNFQVLQNILLQENIKDNDLSVISIAGAFRKGKSFMLSFFIRYLDEVINKNNPSNWLGDVNLPLSGFSWTGGSERHTSGIWIWSEIFTYTLSNGKKIGILLMDTQGTFDNNSSMRENVTIFSFSVLLSSVQIYNLSNNIQEDDLQNLQLFTEYGKLALKDNPLKPFQDLFFLIRDWSYPYESQYGLEGGKNLLNKVLEIKGDHPEELKKVRRNIVQCFEQLKCFLMPYPGKKAAMDPNFNGKVLDLDQEFVEELKPLAELVLKKENLIVKKANGTNLTAKEFLNYVQTYWGIYESENLPNPSTIYEATSEANSASAMELAQNVYESNMQRISGNTYDFGSLITQHSEFHRNAIKMFEDKALIGDNKIKRKYFNKLIENIQRIEIFYFLQNQSKHSANFSAVIGNLNAEVQRLLAENGIQNSNASGLEGQIAQYRETSEATKSSLRAQIAGATEAKRLQEAAVAAKKKKEQQDAICMYYYLSDREEPAYCNQD